MNFNRNIHYILEKYHSGGSNRYTCPNCGQKKSFTRYVDIDTGEYLADDCGKCNHESSCGYHYPPRDFFRDHPEHTNDFMEKEHINCSRTILSHKRQNRTFELNSITQTVFFDIDWAIKGMSRNSSFKMWLASLSFDAERIKEVITDYYLGGTANNVYVDGINYGAATVFWMIDEKMMVHDAKLIAYNTNGHRVQGWGNSMRSICKKTGKGPQLEETEKVLFGLHLINKYPEKSVCIVESEKTAIICACRYPEYIWMASGGCGNLQPYKLKPLHDRHIAIFPDSGEYDKWKKCLQNSGHQDYNVASFLEQYIPNTDIADIILGEAQLKESSTTDSTVNGIQQPPANDVPDKGNDNKLLSQMDLLDAMKENPFDISTLEESFKLLMYSPKESCPY